MLLVRDSATWRNPSRPPPLLVRCDRARCHGSSRRPSFSDLNLEINVRQRKYIPEGAFPKVRPRNTPRRQPRCGRWPTFGCPDILTPRWPPTEYQPRKPASDAAFRMPEVGLEPTARPGNTTVSRGRVWQAVSPRVKAWPPGGQRMRRLLRIVQLALVTDRQHPNLVVCRHEAIHRDVSGASV